MTALECLDCGHTWGNTSPTNTKPSTQSDSPAELLRQRWDWRHELGAAGWTLTKDGHDSLWTRPGKSPRDGHSAVLGGSRMSATIKVRARFIGFHAWPDAPERRDYLRDRHRHEFHVEVAARVAHDDRDIEFHDFKDDVLACLPEHGANLGASSCELIARTILARLERDYGSSLLWCEVWEDGEVGARVDYVPPIPEVEGDGAVFEAVER